MFFTSQNYLIIIAYTAMADFPSADSSDSSDDDVSFFEQATGEGLESSGSDRVQELKRMLFDLAYLIMNADGTEHISEQMLVRKLEGRMEREGSVDVEARNEELSSLLEEGPEAIRGRVEKLATQFEDRAGDRLEALGSEYLEFLKGLIVADATVTDEEHQLFDVLCEEWGIEVELPSS